MVLSGDLEQFKRIIPFKDNHNETLVPYKYTALHLCCITGEVDYLNLLLDFNVDVNAVDIFGYTPLHKACQIGNIQVK